MKVKIATADGPTLDWMVAKCEGEVTELVFDGFVWGFKLNGKQKVLSKGWAESMMYLPSTDWAQGGPIVEREKIEVTPPVPDWCEGADDKDWMATSLPPTRGDATLEVGPTPLIAAMRCYVVSKLGNEVEVPDELA